MMLCAYIWDIMYQDMIFFSINVLTFCLSLNKTINIQNAFYLSMQFLDMYLQEVPRKLNSNLYLHGKYLRKFNMLCLLILSLVNSLCRYILLHTVFDRDNYVS